MRSTMCAWCIVARLSHRVVTTEVPMAPAVIRTKLLRPEAEGMRSGVSPASVIALKGMKKNAMAPPCRMVGTMMVLKSA